MEKHIFKMWRRQSQEMFSLGLLEQAASVAQNVTNKQLKQVDVWIKKKRVTTSLLLPGGWSHASSYVIIANTGIKKVFSYLLLCKKTV